MTFSAAAMHREFFSESYKIKPKSDCIYHVPIEMKKNWIGSIASDSDVGIASDGHGDSF